MTFGKRIPTDQRKCKNATINESIMILVDFIVSDIKIHAIVFSYPHTKKLTELYLLLMLYVKEEQSLTSQFAFPLSSFCNEHLVSNDVSNSHCGLIQI